MKIRQREANYILQVKDNQLNLKKQIEKLFNRKTTREEAVSHDCGYGRIGKRKGDSVKNFNMIKSGFESIR